VFFFFLRGGGGGGGGGGGVVTTLSPVCAHGFFADKAHSKLITIFALLSPLFFSSSLFSF